VPADASSGSSVGQGVLHSVFCSFFKPHEQHFQYLKHGGDSFTDGAGARAGVGQPNSSWMPATVQEPIPVLSGHRVTLKANRISPLQLRLVGCVGFFFFFFC